MYWLRHKLHRWGLPGYPRLVTERILRRLRSLGGVAQPRVQVAVLGTLFNRWPTRRRFQQPSEGHCALGCGGEDAIEHYLKCPVARRFLRDHLRLDVTVDEMPRLCFLCSPPAGEGDTRSLWCGVGRFVYAMYRTTNALRRQPVAGEDQVRRALLTALHEAGPAPAAGEPGREETRRTRRRLA